MNLDQAVPILSSPLSISQPRNVIRFEASVSAPSVLRAGFELLDRLEAKMFSRSTSSECATVMVLVVGITVGCVSPAPGWDASLPARFRQMFRIRILAP